MNLSQVSIDKSWQNITIRRNFFLWMCTILYRSIQFSYPRFVLVNSSNIMCQTWWKIFVNDLNSIVKIPVSDNFIDQQISFFSQCFLRVPYLHNDSTIFKHIFPRRLSFFFSYSSFSFPLFCLFPLSFLIFLFFFFFSNLHHFLNLVCRFLRAPLPYSRTFCCPA